MGYKGLQKNIIDAAKKPKKKKGGCGCGRSHTGLCIGWHSLTEERYKNKKIEWEKWRERKNKEIGNTELKKIELYTDVPKANIVWHTNGIENCAKELAKVINND